MYNFYDEVLKEKENIVRDLMDILKYDTVLKQEYDEKSNYPFGKNLKDVLDFMENISKRDGLKFENVLNHACEIEIGSGKEIFGILAHLDVVPATGKWDNPPFNPIIKDNKIFARGVVDDKGASIICYYCLKILNKLKIQLNKRVRLILGVDEESGSRCIHKYLTVREEPTLAFSPDADFPIIYGEKGILSFTICGQVDSDEIILIKSGTRTNLVPDETIVELKNNYDQAFISYLKKYNVNGSIVEKNTYKFIGKSSHAMNPSEGINSNFLLFEFLNDIKIKNNLTSYFNDYFLNDVAGKKLNINSYCEEMKYLTLNLGTLVLENTQFEIGINIRYPKADDYTTVINKLNLVNKNYNFKLDKMTNLVPHKVSKDSILVKELLKAYCKYADDKNPEPFTIGGGTYARLFKNGVAFGPVFKNREDFVHKENECMDILDLMNACAIYLEGIYNLCV